jgi:hypothetical protein
MITLFKELADRFIEFVLGLVKGETLEEQLTSALKSAIFLVSVLGFVVTALLVSNLNLRIELSDMEAGVSKVNLLFDSEGGGPIRGFLRINDVLSEQNAVIKQENILLLKGNVKLTGENHWLQLHLVEVLDENKLLRDNNKVLLLKCGKPS